jgi:hypothetical protein
MYNASVRPVGVLVILQTPPPPRESTGCPVPRGRADNEQTRCTACLLASLSRAGSRALLPLPPPKLVEVACSPAKSSPPPVPKGSTRNILSPHLPSPPRRRTLLAGAGVQRDVHSRHSTEEKRIGRCGGDDPRPKPRSPCRGGGGDRSWWRLSHGPFSRSWCWVTTAASFTQAWWSGNDNYPSDDTIHHCWDQRLLPRLISIHGRIPFSSCIISSFV